MDTTPKNKPLPAHQDKPWDTQIPKSDANRLIKKEFHPDRLLFLTGDELSTTEAAALEKHLQNCQSCRLTRENFLRTRSQILGKVDQETTFNTDPVKHNTPDINVEDITAKPLPAKKMLRLIQYVTSTAALILILIFVAEQVRSVQHISNLEKRFANQNYLLQSNPIDQWTLRHTKHNWIELAQRHKLYQISTITLIPLNLSEILEYENLLKELLQAEIRKNYPNHDSEKSNVNPSK
ncbi:MAG: zf-HC2 domain-containing protein [Bacteroidales bacterium]|jgi:hypothetical protein|nr:zf-HC2 domain-containing protein [Bacteroidales bacterium]MDD2571389.1 zf-HC2 domain-containing protein [Bacteroidales bacterium]MDD2813328.1 zf-HC2 domain-containing protein [Bacteroidales bacterium]MDD3385872.1 zf-HC2 domain-containing protein [Bacteroidales bacterium]MDD3811771.1 zf-HC2 domain-containing protein [Bacteroidales bacterium]